MEVTIREGMEKDHTAILGLIKELALFEKTPEKVTNTVELMKEEKEHFHSLMAETTDGDIIGMAVYFFAYYTWVGKSLYLDDLYVKKSHRSKKTTPMRHTWIKPCPPKDSRWRRLLWIQHPRTNRCPVQPNKKHSLLFKQTQKSSVT